MTKTPQEKAALMKLLKKVFNDKKKTSSNAFNAFKEVHDLTFSSKFATANKIATDQESKRKRTKILVCKNLERNNDIRRRLQKKLASRKESSR
jgi:NADH:ubiquinone oxidoreductase subunit E